MPSSRSTETADCEIVSSRVFAVPCAQVFQAWIDPARLARWWGPAGFSNSFHEFALKPGGHWRFTMHGPDGKDYENHSIFVEITAPERIVLDHISAPPFRVVASFEAQGPDTKLTFRMVFDSAELCASVGKYAVAANEQNLDRLAAELSRLE